jgi:GT2 family glycosyltransferase
MDLSVIIVNYNVRHFLEQCLISVRKAAENISAETIVVDNNSADGSCSMVTMNFPEVQLIRNSVNSGFSAACNQAIKVSSGRYILLLNPDTVVEEDTFKRCLTFMEDHTDAGAVGVKMINGNGRFLPESKRSLPTPATAFFKMAGFSRLFPKSRLFNRYYMGHLDSSETAEADILSGAFMFIRRNALDKTGLLDETYFMYGEDIDLSYRLINAGYKNYYYPGVKIIHYKGESTRKGDINHIVHFYRAMLIFIGRHFGKKGHGPFLMLIGIAIYFWGFIAVVKNIFRRYILPVSDSATIIILLIFIIHYWGRYRFGGDYDYPGLFKALIIPGYTIIIVTAVFLSGGYKIPSKIWKVVRGVISGSGAVLVIYALLPQELRFSRAVMIMGSVLTLFLITLQRLLFAIAGIRLVYNPFPRARKVVIVSDSEGYGRIRGLISESESGSRISGRVGINSDDLGAEVLGSLGQLREIIRVNRIDEVIISARELTASQIIDSMQLIADSNVTIRISPSGEKLIIGSNYVKG